MPVDIPVQDTEQDKEEELRDLLAKGGLGKAYAADTDATPAQPADSGTPAVPTDSSPSPSPAASPMGNAYREPMGPPVPPELQQGQAVSPAAKSLTEFSLATGANVAPLKTHME